MEWFNVKDLEELKQLGSFNEVRAQIKAEGFNNLHVSGRSWGGLLKSIEDFRKKILNPLIYQNILTPKQVSISFI